MAEGGSVAAGKPVYATLIVPKPTVDALLYPSAGPAVARPGADAMLSVAAMARRLVVRLIDAAIDAASVWPYEVSAAPSRAGVRARLPEVARGCWPTVATASRRGG